MTRQSVIVLMASLVFCGLCAVRGEYEPYPRFFSQALRRVERDYVEKIDPQTIFDGAMEGIVAKLDHYSEFSPRAQTMQLEEMFEQHFGGIGVQLSSKGDEGIVIVSPMRNSPAFRAGLRHGDRIVEINGQDARKLSLDEAHERLVGPRGELLRLTIERPGISEPFQVQIVRDEIHVDSVTGFGRNGDNSWNWWLPGNAKIAYVRPLQFEKHTTDEFEAALTEFASSEPRGLVVDLRDNPGGLLGGAARVCELFLPRGSLIVSTRGRGGRLLDEHVVANTPPYPDLPLVVLINQNSASAAEIIAACLQDHGRAQLVGQKTWGKGTVQHLIETEGGRSRLRLTVATYWRPNGKNIHRLKNKEEDADGDWGVQPSRGCEVALSDPENDRLRDAFRDLQIVRQPEEPAPPSAGENYLQLDPQLRKALELLTGEDKAPTSGP